MADMTYKDLIAAKRHMEEDLRVMIARRIDSFQQETGLFPSAISVAVIDVTTFGGQKEYTISNVQTDIQL